MARPCVRFRLASWSASSDSGSRARPRSSATQTFGRIPWHRCQVPMPDRSGDPYDMRVDSIYLEGLATTAVGTGGSRGTGERFDAARGRDGARLLAPV